MRRCTASLVICIAVTVTIASALPAWSATLNAATGTPRRVLLLHSFGPHFPPWNTISTRFRQELRDQSPYGIDIYEASLQGDRFSPSDEEGPFINYLHALFTERGLDLVVALGAPATRFVLQNRPKVFPSTPLLITAVDERTFSDADLARNDTMVRVRFDEVQQIESILQVLPHTTEIAVAIGDSPLERFWVELLQRSFERLTGRVAFRWFNKLSADEMVQGARALPAYSAIYYATVRVDVKGVPQEEDRMFWRIREIANVPMFSYIDDHFGQGIVGGLLLSSDQIARQAAAVAVRILSGETAGDIKTPTVGMSAPVYDWRELQRWKISEAALPPGSIVEFREPTAWEQYRRQIVATAALILLQAVMIISLLYEYRRRRHSEIAAHELSGRLITAHEEERARLARELHDDVTQRLALLAIQAGREEGKLTGPAGGSAMRTMREGLVRLSEDVHGLSYRLHPSILEDLGLTEALKSECERFSQTCSTRLETSVRDVPETLARDVALCLYRIAQEGLRNIARHAGASQAGVRVQRLDGGLQLTIEDDGAGFDPAQHRIRPSLGHAGMRQRVRLLGGKIEIDSSPGHGTTILAWLPLRQAGGEPSAHAAG
jgi:signal transduction histidine kinase